MSFVIITPGIEGFYFLPSVDAGIVPLPLLFSMRQGEEPAQDISGLPDAVVIAINFFFALAFIHEGFGFVRLWSMRYASDW